MTGAHCAIYDCTNGIYKLKRWQKTHDCPAPPKNEEKKCGCKPPFVLIPFPTVKKDPDGRKRWTKLVNRKDVETGKPWEPTKNSRVCSEHFHGGKPSKEYPDPCLNLGYYDIRSLSNTKKRKEPTGRTAPAPRRKRLNLEVFESEVLETQKETENLEGVIIELYHVDHNYMQRQWKCWPKREPNCCPKPEPECEPDCCPKPEPECWPKREPQWEPKREPEWEPMCEPKWEPEWEPKREPEWEPKREPECGPNLEPECEYVCDPECGPNLEPECEPMCEPAPNSDCPGCAQKQTELDKLIEKVDMLTINQKSKRKHDKCDKFVDTDAKVRANTGLQNREVFDKLLEFVTPKASRMRYWEGPKRVMSTKVRTYTKTPTKCGPKRKMSVKQELLLVLMKLRLGLKNHFLASIFDTTETTCSRLIHTWVRFLAHQLKNLVFWPDKEHIKQMTAASLAREYPNLRCIIDCSETFLERPQDVKLQAATWSDYKNNNTLKYLVAVAPNGHISFISQAWGGRASDRYIVQNSKFLDLIEPNDVVMADHGSPIQEDLLFRRASLVIPPSSSDGDQMCQANVLKTKKILKTRIHVERAINRLNWFKIISNTLPVTMAYLFDDILLICAALCNLLPPLIF